ncbi:MAG: hypothetical protein V7636_947, partial [Actinomycetota bacterium]
MQPASDSPSGGGGSSSSLRRWGPIAGIIVVIAVIVGIVVASGGDDDDSTSAGGGTATTQAGATGADDYPVSFSAAKDAGVKDIDWGDRCDTDTGQIAIPSYYAPECYKPWPAGQDNGGATADGVTADSIKVVVYLAPEVDPVLDYITDAIHVDDTNDQIKDTISKWSAMLETYEETYGRHVDLQYYVSQGTSTDAVTARADAVKIAETIHPFQVWGGPALTTAFGDELTARGIQCYGCGIKVNDFPSANALQGNYLGGAMSTEEARYQNVQALSKQVSGQKAEYAGDAAMQKEDRKFGYLYISTSDDSAKQADKYKQQLADAGVTLSEMVPYTLDPATLQETAANAISKLKSAGVTTIIFSGDPIAPRDFTKEATTQNYFPEWFLNLSVLIDTNVFSRTYDQQQWKHAFGLSALTTRIDPKSAGEITGFYIYNWFYGSDPLAKGTIGVDVPAPSWFYRTLQEVGPNLTHETFRDALFRLEPSHRGVTSPYSTWGDHGIWKQFEGKDFEGIDDITKIWWDPDQQGEDEIHNAGKGVWQFVDGGKRYLPNEWKKGDFGAFDTEGAAGILD